MITTSQYRYCIASRLLSDRIEDEPKMLCLGCYIVLGRIHSFSAFADTMSILFSARRSPIDRRIQSKPRTRRSSRTTWRTPSSGSDSKWSYSMGRSSATTLATYLDVRHNSENKREYLMRHRQFIDKWIDEANIETRTKMASAKVKRDKLAENKRKLKEATKAIQARTPKKTEKQQKSQDTRSAFFENSDDHLQFAAGQDGAERHGHAAPGAGRVASVERRSA